MSGIHSTPKPFGFIQARLGSSRLSGKILERIPEKEGLTLLEHIYFRLRKILPHEKIVFLIPNSEPDLASFLAEKGFQFFKGSLDDVRDRYINAAKEFGAKDIIRLTGDNPFIDITSIELLWEAMFYIKERNYSLAMQGLPLGMGVECFSSEGLFQNTDRYQEVRHREHVSLHIKEDLVNNHIYRLSPPHLKDRDRQNSQNIRMTIDEELDLSMMRTIWDKIGKENPFFGAGEIFELYKAEPDLFLKNQPVKQVSFELPKAPSQSKNISLVYGEPVDYGSGHFERCKSLSIELQMKGYNVICNPTVKEKFDAYIVDARETNPSGYPALTIDHLGIKDNKIQSAYFLPHFDLTENMYDPASFYSSPLIENFINKPLSDGQWLIYAGSLSVKQCTALDEFVLNILMDDWEIKSVIRVGGSIPIDPNIKYFSRLTKYEYLDILSHSVGFISYFGQSIMEALYLEKKTAIFGMTEIHKKLGEFFSKHANLNYLGEPGNFKKQPLTKAQALKMNRNAQNQIFKWLETL
jgi:spore coat polysaccharide biosynthesis protein SpsF